MFNYRHFGKNRVWTTVEDLVQSRRETDLRWAFLEGILQLLTSSCVLPTRLGTNRVQDTVPWAWYTWSHLTPTMGFLRGYYQPHFRHEDTKLRKAHCQAQVPIFTKWHCEDVSPSSWPQGSSPSTLPALHLKYEDIFRAAWRSGSSEIPSDTKISQILGKCLPRFRKINRNYL